MRYRRLHVRYAAVAPSGHAWPFDDLWPTDRVRILVQASWRPEADLYETPTTVEAIVALPGIEEDDVVRAVERTVAAAPDVEIGICDTTGRAAPDQLADQVPSPDRPPRTTQAGRQRTRPADPRPPPGLDLKGES